MYELLKKGKNEPTTNTTSSKKLSKIRLIGRIACGIPIRGQISMTVKKIKLFK